MPGQNRHPRPEKLLEACLGELPGPQAERVEQHIEECAACRNDMDSIRAALAEFGGSYEEQYKPGVPPPPGNWESFRAALREREAEPVPAGTQLWARLAPLLSARRVASAAAALALILGVIASIQRMRVAPAVSAKELLARAAAAEQKTFEGAGNSAVRQKLRIRAGGHTLTRTVYRDIARRQQVSRWSEPESGAGDSRVEPALATELSAEFRRARLNWDDPLSPSTLGPWIGERAGWRDASESVKRDGTTLRLISVTPHDRVQETEITVREADYHPVAARVEFRDRGEVQLTETAYQILRIEALESSVRAELLGPPPPVEVSVAKRPAPSATAAAADLDDLELQTRYALHRHQADLGQEVRVERTADGTIAVKGLAATEERRSELRAALSGIPRLKIDIETEEEAARRQAAGAAPASEAAEPAERRPAVLDQALRERYPDQQERDAFVVAALESSQQALARGFALEKLARRYSDDDVARLTPESRTRLRAMAEEHEQALRSALQNLFHGLDALMGSESPAASEPVERRPWQEVSKALVPELQELNRHVIELVSTGPSDADSALAGYRDCVGRVQVRLTELLLE